MSLFDDIEKDITEDAIIDNTVNNSLYGVYTILDINSGEDFVNYILSVTHLEELISHIHCSYNKFYQDFNFIPMLDISKYSNNLYEITIDKKLSSYRYYPLGPNYGFDISIILRNINGSIMLTLTSPIYYITLIDWLHIYDVDSNVQQKVNSIINNIKDILLDKFEYYFSLNYIKFVQTQICTHRTKDIQIPEDILSYKDTCIYEHIKYNSLLDGPNIGYAIGILIVYILQNKRLFQFIKILNNTNLLIYFFPKEYRRVTNNANHNEWIEVIEILKEHNILNHISIFDFIDKLMYYNKKWENLLNQILPFLILIYLCSI